jgi:protein MAK11
MGKRKRGAPEECPSADASGRAKVQKPAALMGTTSAGADGIITIQIIAGSYERVLHGITAEIRRRDAPAEGAGAGEGSADAQFSDTFLFHAHTSAIRCLALSPPSTDGSTQNQKVLLATGSSDERINLYHLSASPPPRNHKGLPVPSLTNNAITENPKNRELGSLMHHSGAVTALHFPTRSKLLSSAEDSTIAVVRSRDWTVLSTIKAPIPKALGRPSGDTAPPGGMPAGVSDFAVHPSMKLVLSVGRGEKCMRLWNLVTGKKAGVLNFGREILQDVGEGKWGSGEGRRVLWNHNGEEFAVGFERGAVVFGLVRGYLTDQTLSSVSNPATLASIELQTQRTHIPVPTHENTSTPLPWSSSDS